VFASKALAGRAAHECAAGQNRLTGHQHVVDSYCLAQRTFVRGGIGHGLGIDDDDVGDPARGDPTPLAETKAA